MTAIELADQKGRARALAFYLFATIIAAVLGAGWVLGPAAHAAEFLRGFWLGISIVAVLFLLPWGRWLRPSAPLARLLDDESVREHRRTSCTAGFWASMAAALATTLLSALIEPAPWPLSAFDTARVIATAAIVATFVTFATLELRAARG